MFHRLMIAATAIATSSLLIAPTVEAKPATISVTVETGDLDLRSPAGRAALRERAHRLVVESCGKAHQIDLQGRRGVRECRADALAQVEAALAAKR
ncbi:UrcA family protein [Sphingomicrobium arenosum]|uniref:UrcA family protein n=1 Tax=Sphingomicrobium arenosum TaxID=2233861 RepID=UPI002240B5AD|nr:UrcA family protein [Sphingomicrobium arenosum]